MLRQPSEEMDTVIIEETKLIFHVYGLVRQEKDEYLKKFWAAEILYLNEWLQELDYERERLLKTDSITFEEG